MRKLTAAAILAIAVPLLGGCVAGTDRFVGPVKGCGSNTSGVLDIRGANFLFTPDQGVLQIHGTVSPTGELQGTETEGPANLSDRITMSFTGTRDKHTITGKLTEPGCALDVNLTER